MTKRILFDGDTIEHKGREYRVEFPHDDMFREPWKECDGHGVVSKHKHHAFGMGSKPPKAPGERILYWERGTYRTYDMQATLAIAKKRRLGFR